VRRANGKLGVALTESAGPKVKTWREDVRTTVLADGPHRPITGPVRATILFYLARPKSHYRTGRNAHLLRDSAPLFPTTKPDIDKITRSTLDALTSAGAYSDDSQVVSTFLAKHYADGVLPGAIIHITEITE